MPSLKSYISELASLLGVTPAFLYERQRVLVRGGQLRQCEGRGPGSGVKATPETVATLLVAGLVADNLFETEARTQEVLALHRNGASFGGRLSKILGSEDEAAAVKQIVVGRSAPSAKLLLKSGDTSQKGYTVVETYHELHANVSREPAVRVIVEVDGEVVQKIARDLSVTSAADASS